jgi:hypothetical protein
VRSGIHSGNCAANTRSTGRYHVSPRSHRVLWKHAVKRNSSPHVIRILPLYKNGPVLRSLPLQTEFAAMSDIRWQKKGDNAVVVYSSRTTGDLVDRGVAPQVMRLLQQHNASACFFNSVTLGPRQ